MLKKTIDQSEVIMLLNELLLKDPECIRALVAHRVPCNDAIANHPTIQVHQHKDQKQPLVGLLGLLNGLFGIREDGFGAFIMEIDDEGNILKFKATEEFRPEHIPDSDKNMVDRYEKEIKRLLPEFRIPREAMTCYRCAREPSCIFAWNAFNTDGDCLKKEIHEFRP